jgi:hypothetical protein
LCDAGGRCAECADGATDRCLGTATPICSLALASCVACSEDDHCKATLPGGICRSTGLCGCAGDGACNPGFICSASSCMPGCRPRAERCPLGLACIAEPESDLGTCGFTGFEAAAPPPPSSCAQVEQPLVSLTLYALFAARSRRPRRLQ